MRERIIKLNQNLLPVSLWAATAVALTACPTAPVTNSPGSNNANIAVSTPAPAAAAQTPTPAVASDSNSSSGSLATPTDAYRTAHALRAKKDVQGMKRVLSKDILEFFTEMGKVENKSLDQMLLELCEKPQTATAESRNEKITGNRAIIEYKEPNGEWKEMDFEKEGGEWKLTLPEAEGPGKKP